MTVWGKKEGVAVFMRLSMHLGGYSVFLAQRTANDRPFKDLWAAPGGSVEDGESAIDAAIRELKEETGLEISPGRLFYIDRLGPFVTPVAKQGSGTPYHMVYFGVDLEPGEEPQMTEPHKQSSWLPFQYPYVTTIPLCPGTPDVLDALMKIPPKLYERVSK